jgi:geranyl-CoA carboxylase alpha subunit
MKYFEVEIEGELIKVWAEVIGQRVWLHRRGETIALETETRRTATAGSKTNPGEVLAPMPGKVLKCAVVAGQSVKKGDLLVSMEAMKMEYSFAAEVDGTIEVLNCKVGDQVALNQLLVRLKT